MYDEISEKWRDEEIYDGNEEKLTGNDAHGDAVEVSWNGATKPREK